MANAGVDTGANMLGVETASVTAIRWTIIAVETPAVSGASQRAEKHGGMAPNVLELTLLVWLGALGAGVVGALTGLGGGIVIVPMLTLLFKVDMRYAIGAALVSVIATSSGAAAAYVREGYSNIRVGMFMEVATTTGALAGAFLAGLIPTSALAVVFGLFLLYSAIVTMRARREGSPLLAPDPTATRLGMNSTYPVAHGRAAYYPQHVGLAWGLMAIAGLLSGLLGIGSGALKVLAMDRIMRLPFKVSTTTSNFMIGVTAAASAGIYLGRGYIDPGLAMPVMLGVLAGAFVGSRLLVVAHTATLRVLLAVVIVALAVQMTLHGLAGWI